MRRGFDWRGLCDRLTYGSELVVIFGVSVVEKGVRSSSYHVVTKTSWVDHEKRGIW